MEKRRVRKGIVKKSIKAIWIIIFILLILIIGAFLFSEKVHKIDMIDNIKNRLLGQVEDVININDNIVDREMNENIVYEDGISGGATWDNCAIGTFGVEDDNNTSGKPEKLTDEDISDFYNKNVAIIVRCVNNSAHNGWLARLAVGSYTIGDVEIYDGSNTDLNSAEWLYMCKVHIDQEYYLNLWHKNFQSTRGTHWLYNSEKDVYAPFYYFAGGYCSYSGQTLDEGWYCLTEEAPVYVDITHIWNEEKEEYKIEYYYDNIIDNSKTEILEKITEEIINSKKESGKRENYSYEKVEKEGNIVKIYYVSKTSENNDNHEEKEEYKIEYYYDNIIDNSKTETLEKITEEIINSKKESGQKENYTYEKTVKEGNVVKIYYVSTGSEEPTKPSKLYTITVKNEKAGHTYNSYQVFAGDFAYDKENQPILSNIVWSEEFQKIVENEKTYGDKLIEKLKDPNENTYASLFTDCQTALDIAEILAGKEDDGAEIREFTKVTGKFILENNIKITKGVSEQTTETIAGEEVKSYKITELEAGYYIVIDAKANIEDDAYSRYLIDVVQDVTMEPKSSIPTLSKKVTTNNIEGSEKVNTALHIENGEYDIGFEIVTTIGTDMDAYGSEYKYEVVDILDKGFEYDRESVKIYVGENNVECGKESYTLSDILITEENYNTYKEYFEEGEPSEQYGKTVVLIDFKDIPGKVSRGELLEGQKITINYNAKLNKNCEVGKVANVNKAYLKYSNNPYQIDNTAKTKTVTTLTYTISLNIEKIGEIKTEETEKQYLSGAIFDIYDEPEYKEGILIPEKNQNRKLIGTVEIGEEGKAKYNSLGAGTYYIKESKAPDGYNMLKEEIEMKVIATYDGFDINWEVEDKSNSKLVLIEKEIAEGTNINLEIQNTKGVQLPVTGGMGTLIFTVVGIGIMGLAVIGMKK